MTSGWNDELVAQQSIDGLDRPAAPFLLRWEDVMRRYFGAIAFSIATIIVVLEWIPILFGGLWLDETFTWWQAHRGWHNAYAVVSNSPGVPPLFAAVSSLFYFGPGKYMEFWLRLPTFVAMLLSAFLLFRLAEAWFGRNDAWLALVMFVSEKEIINRATEARPYGLAMAACLGIMYGLHVWLSQKRAWGWLLFLASTILAPYWQVLFCAFFVVPALYIVCWGYQGRRVPWLALAGSALLILATWLPLRPQLMALLAKGNTLSFAEVPTFDTFMDILLPPRFVVSAFLSVIAAQLLLSDKLDSDSPCTRFLPARILALIALFWMVSGPVELFAASKLKGYGLLVERYTSYATAGMALVAANFFARARTYTAQVATVVIFGMVSIAAAASHHWHGPSMGSWREPAREISRTDPTGQVPVLFASGFVESNFLDWEHSTGPETHIYAPLQVYPIANQWYPLPYKLDDRAKAQTDRLLNGKLNGQPRIMLLAYEPSALTEWVTQRLEDRHYTMHLTSPDSIVLQVFDAQK